MYIYTHIKNYRQYKLMYDIIEIQEHLLLNQYSSNNKPI